MNATPTQDWAPRGFSRARLHGALVWLDERTQIARLTVPQERIREFLWYVNIVASAPRTHVVKQRYGNQHADSLRRGGVPEDAAAHYTAASVFSPPRIRLAETPIVGDVPPVNPTTVETRRYRFASARSTE